MARGTQQQAGEQEQQSQQPSQGQSSQQRPGGTTDPQQAAGTAAANREREREIGVDRDTGRQPGRSTSMTQQRPGASVAQGGRYAAHPFNVLQRMSEDMDQLFEQFGFGRMGLSPLLGSSLGSSLGGGMDRDTQALWAPQVEVRQRGDKLVVRADLPGVRKEDLDISVENDVLTLSGERSDAHEEENDGIYHSERSYGRFRRAIPLPKGSKPEECNASFRDGVLEVTIPTQSREQQKRRIQIR